MLNGDHQTPNSVAADVRRTWIIGGALLLASVLVSVAIPPGTFIVFGGSTIGTVLFSASLLLFAFGIRGAGSITARRPLGTAALTVLAVWAVLGAVLRVVGVIPADLLLTFSNIDSFVQFGVAVIVVSQIARVGVVPRPWNWAPVWALAAVAASWLLQIVLVGIAQNTPSIAQNMGSISMILVNVESFVRLGCPLFLGVLAIVLATRASRTNVAHVNTTSG